VRIQPITTKTRGMTGVRTALAGLARPVTMLMPAATRLKLPLSRLGFQAATVSSLLAGTPNGHQREGVTKRPRELAATVRCRPARSTHGTHTPYTHCRLALPRARSCRGTRALQLPLRPTGAPLTAGPLAPRWRRVSGAHASCERHRRRVGWRWRRWRFRKRQRSAYDVCRSRDALSRI